MGEETIVNCRDESEVKPEDCKLKQFERNKYFYGKLMTVSDFDLEQRYLNEKRHLVNRLVHGTGIVCGLEVSAIEETEKQCICGPDGKIQTIKGWDAAISAGVAMDCMGREIVVSNSDRYFISEELPKELPQYFGLYIRRKDVLKGPVPSLGNTTACEEICCYSHVREDFELVFGELYQPTRLFFDRTTYAANDEVVVYLVEPIVEGEPDASRTFNLLVPSKEIVEKDIPLTPEDVDPAQLAGMKIFRGTYDLNKLDTDVIGKLDAGTIIATEYTAATSGEKYTSTTNIGGSKSDLIEKKRIGNDYFKVWLKECVCCEDPTDPKVLLSVLTISQQEEEEKKVTILGESSILYRKIVYNNPMLYDLMTQLLSAKQPGQIPEPINAIKTINDVGNKGDKVIPNIDLISKKKSILITQESDHEINLETANVAGDLTTTGTVDVELDEEHAMIIKEIPHKAKSRDGSPPCIDLGLSKKNGESNTVDYMEDMLLYSLYKDVKDLAALTEDPSATNDDRNELIRISDDPNPDESKEGTFRIFFKAININKSRFDIFVANFDIRHKYSFTIRWWATPARTVTT